MLSVRLDITLSLVGPILTKSSVAGPAGISAAMAMADGSYYLPYSLVRGRLRESMEELGSSVVVELFGPSVATKTTGDPVVPKRGLLQFSDFKAVQSGASMQRLGYRVSIDPERGSAAKRDLLVMDRPFAPGEIVAFSGSISFFATAEEQVQKIEREVTLGLRFLTNLGSGRTVGFGRLKDVTVVRAQCQPGPQPRSTSTPVPETACWTLTLSDFSGPLCIVRRPLGKNLFISDDTIPGGVIKGALAELLRKLTISDCVALRSNLDRVRFTHAFPGQRNRPFMPPLSLVKVEVTGQKGGPARESLLDGALCRKPFLVNDRAPSFAIDWKDTDSVRKQFGWPHLTRELRVRTAIDRERRRAEDGKLFAYEMIKPGKTVWHGLVDLQRVNHDERQKVAAELAAVLLRGLPGIGKTKAHARAVTMEPQTTPKKAKRHDGCWILCLQTPALLLDPLNCNAGLDPQQLKALYQSAFDDLLPADTLAVSPLIIDNFFARQAMYGGYLVHRFQAPTPPERPYYPFLLTEPGSVFVVRPSANTDSEKAQATIQSWVDHGLPLPRWAAERYGSNWSTCPFLPENGFGEVAISPFSDDARKAPGFQEVPNVLDP
jgi:hypothetical protein